MEAILNGCQADGSQCVIWVGLFQSLCTFLRHSVNPLLLSKVFTDQIEVKKKNPTKQRIRVCKFFLVMFYDRKLHRPLCEPFSNLYPPPAIWKAHYCLTQEKKTSIFYQYENCLTSQMTLLIFKSSANINI